MSDLRSQIEAHRAQLGEHRASLDAWRAQYDALLAKSIDRMTKAELIILIHRKDDELAILRNRLARYGSPEATAAQLSAVQSLMEDVRNEKRNT